MCRAVALMGTAGLCAVFVACAGNATWRARPPVPQPPTQVVGGIVIATLCEDLPDLTEAEVASVAKAAEEHVEGQRVRRIFHTRVHPGEFRELRLQFEYHDTRERIRFSRWMTVYFEKDGDGRGTWTLETELEPSLGAEICAPGLSFLNGKPVPSSDLVEVWAGEDVAAEELLEIVDAAYNHVPAGEQLRYIDAAGDGTYEVQTEHTDTLRALYGSVLEVRREGSQWEVTVIGEWIS